MSDVQVYRCYATTSTYASTVVFGMSMEDAAEQYAREYGRRPAMALVNGGYYVLGKDGEYSYFPTD